MEPAPFAALIKACRFAAHKHRDQRRKSVAATPYVNHPIEVAETLAQVAGVADLEVLQAALLHDTLEDTETEAAELEAEFGPRVRRLVEEVSDDKALPKQERKRLEVEHAPHLSPGARLIKLADKTCNVRDLGSAPPAGWSTERLREYVAWARRVVAGCRGLAPALEQCFDQVAEQVLASLPGDAI
ncbi:MAG: HD domain-containing protein [Planctomycetota bacterium]